jgi:acetyl-CoA carboxylase carboxyltransferase component
MGGQQAASTLFQIEKSSLEKKGIKLSEVEEKDFLDTIRKRYEAQTDVRYAAARLWVDAIVNPDETRKVLSASLAACDLSGPIPEFKNGVIQV